MTYKDVTMYCECIIANYNDRFKEEIIIQDVATDKIIQADPFINKKPKIQSLRKIFKKIFKKEEKF